MYVMTTCGPQKRMIKECLQKNPGAIKFSCIVLDAVVSKHIATDCSLKVNLPSIRFSSVFFLRFCFSLNKYVLFYPHFYMSISALTKQSHTGQKLSKKNFCKGVQPYFKISLSSFIHKIFEQNFNQYVTVYLVGIWTYKNAYEIAHTFSKKFISVLFVR